MKKLKVYFVAVILFSILIVSCRTPRDTAASAISNSLTPEEYAEGWQLLFDGKTLQGWKRYNHDTIGPLWSVKEGTIMCDGEGLGEGTANIGGSLVTIKQFKNFELKLDYKVSTGGNSGVLYHVIEKPEFTHDYETGPEFQLLDDGGWKGELREEQKAASSYDMYAAPSSKKVNPAGEWNSVRIIYYDGHVEHWLNGEKVVEYEENSDDFKERYNKSKWIEYPAWNKSKTGSISLQDHGAPVYFRNLKIKEL